MQTMKYIGLVVLAISGFAVLAAITILSIRPLAIHLAEINPNWGAALLFLAVGLILAGVIAFVARPDQPIDLSLGLATPGTILVLAYLVGTQSDDWSSLSVWAVESSILALVALLAMRTIWVRWVRPAKPADDESDQSG